MTNKKKLISIRLDPELIERLDNLAPDWNDTRSGLIEFILEKHLPEMTAELTRRRKDAVLARGEEWVEPEEQERREHEALLAEEEANRIADLKERCRR